jgi:hypothetical protein
LLIVPVLAAFDLWLWLHDRQTPATGALACAQKSWRRPAGAAAAGLLLGGLAVRSWSNMAAMQPAPGAGASPFPWAAVTTLPGFVACLGAAADFLTGLAAPLIPFKIAEFLSEVKAELK